MVKTTTENCATEAKWCTCKHNICWVIALIIVINVILNSTATYLILFWSKMPNSNSWLIKQELMNLEYEKVWWKENYEIINKMQKSQIEQYVAQYKQQNWWTKWNEAWATKTEETKTETKTLSKDEIAKIKEGAYIEWDKNAKITIVEYSDLECPFCIRQSTQWVIEAVKEKFWAKVVNNIFKNFRWVPHENSESEAIASLCAWELWWVEAYAKYYKEVFKRSKGGNGTWFSKDALVPLAKELWLNEKKFQACYDSKKNVEIFDKDTAEWKKYWVEWTPGNLIINNETGKYILIAWAYPQSEFEAKIEELLK